MKQKYPLARWSPVKQGNRKMSWGGRDGGRVGRMEDRKQERAEGRSGSQVEEMAPVQPNLSVSLPCQIQGGSRTITHFFSKHQETVRQHAHKHSHYAPARAQTGGTRRTRASSVMHLHVKKTKNKKQIMWEEYLFPFWGVLKFLPVCGSQLLFSELANSSPTQLPQPSFLRRVFRNEIVKDWLFCNKGGTRQRIRNRN